MQWFNRAAFRARAHNNYATWSLYALDGRFFPYVANDALRCRLWPAFYIVDDVDFQTYGDPFDKRVLHLRDVRRGTESCLFSGQSIENDEAGYTANLFALEAEEVPS